MGWIVERLRMGAIFSIEIRRIGGGRRNMHRCRRVEKKKNIGKIVIIIITPERRRRAVRRKLTCRMGLSIGKDRDRDREVNLEKMREENNLRRITINCLTINGNIPGAGQNNSLNSNNFEGMRTFRPLFVESIRFRISVLTVLIVKKCMVLCLASRLR